MSYFVRRYKTDQFTHQRIIEPGFIGAWVHSTGLNEIPFVQEIHYVVIPVDVRFQDLTAAWVFYAGTAGIGQIRWFVYQGRVTRIVDAPGTVFSFGRRFFGHD